MNIHASASLHGRAVLSLPAANDLGFLEAVFSCLKEGRLFSITRNPGDLERLGLPVETAPSGLSGTGWGHFTHVPRISDQPAQIVFTSGTEGRAKAILLSHRNLADVVARLNAAMGVDAGIREYIGVPVSYSFGLGRARAVAAAGGAVFLPDRFDPLQIGDMLAAGQINAISAVPSLWRQVLAAPQAIGRHGDKVRWIEIGSQYMAAADKLAMRQLFPKARILQHYGLTEASRTTFLDIAATPEAALESVGLPAHPDALRIGDDGAIIIRGDHVALGQVNEGGDIRPLADGGGWLETRDRGEIRDGRLYYLGRLDDQINLAGIKLGAEGLEAEIRRMVPLAGDHFAIAPVPDAARGEAVLLVIEEAARDQERLIEEAARLSLSRRGVRSRQGAGSALKLLHLDHLPRTGTGKVQRRLLPELWQRQHDIPAPASLPPAAVDLSPDEARLAGIWARVVGEARFIPEASFHELGGDSLSSVQIGLVMEAERLPRPVIRATLEGRSLREAAALMDGLPVSRDAANLPDATRRSWAVTMTRAVVALSVVLSHWGPGFFGRLGIADAAEAVLAPFYRMGTPGFAAVFGIGIGTFMLPGFAEKRASVLRRLNGSFRLVLLGLAVLGAIQLADLLARGQTIDGLAVANSFYGVLAYYALMLGTARWWLPALARLSQPLPWLLVGLPLLWICWQLVPSLLPYQQMQSLLEWPRLMLVAGYSVFKLTAIASAGMAVGLWFAQQRDTGRAALIMMVAGGLGSVVMALTLIEAHGIDPFGDRDSIFFTSLPGLIFYLSLAVLLTGIMLAALSSWGTWPAPVQLPLKLLLVVGGLALPIYVFHGLVIPGRDLLASLGVPDGLALAVTMGLFLASMALSGRWLWRIYFD
ncbi:AMP-binding protein [Paracoccus fontiphilus]|uniref:AMP-binding protein n=1 Tax=Paracoccus fontiphilus TaxID=1815556 RepID=A0ABV7IKY0_9RHOB|nr:AMP-binding protein [Paracoccus fontiphilus]